MTLYSSSYETGISITASINVRITAVLHVVIDEWMLYGLMLLIPTDSEGILQIRGASPI
jgi:hypothetical protein